MRNVLVMGVVLVATAGTTAFADDEYRIELVSVAGSGCHYGDFAVALSHDRTAFTVSYSDYTAQAGQGHSLTEARKNCVLDIRLHVPNGLTWGIASAQMRGYADLQPNANASARLSFWWQGQPSTAYVTHDIRRSTASYPGTLVTGRLVDDWETNDATGLPSIEWASCTAQRNLNVNTQLRINAPSTDPSSLVSMDALDGSVVTIFHIAIMPCP